MNYFQILHFGSKKPIDNLQIQFACNEESLEETILGIRRGFLYPWFQLSTNSEAVCSIIYLSIVGFLNLHWPNVHHKSSYLLFNICYSLSLIHNLHFTHCFTNCFHVIYILIIIKPYIKTYTNFAQAKNKTLKAKTKLSKPKKQKTFKKFIIRSKQVSWKKVKKIID